MNTLILISSLTILLYIALGIAQVMAYYALFHMLLYTPSLTNNIVFAIVLPFILFILFITYQYIIVYYRFLLQIVKFKSHEDLNTRGDRVTHRLKKRLATKREIMQVKALLKEN